ncbi:MAG TPA: hypothetical protein VFB38_00275 [Chthonomonadaceae bacterium]|nr:hypothetical protein [Chthonomonadaceae bacterium]
MNTIATAYPRGDLAGRFGFPVYTILFQVPGIDDLRQAPQLHFQDLTEAIGHDGQTRFFHIMYDYDTDRAARVVELMARNFAGFYAQLLEAQTEDGETNVLCLPDLNDSLRDSMELVEVNLRASRFTNPCIFPGACPCSAMILTPAPDWSVSCPIGCHFNCVNHNLPL